MTAAGLLALSLLIIVLGIVAVLTALAVSTSAKRRRDQRRPEMEAATLAVVSMLSTDDRDASAAQEQLLALTEREQAEVLLELAPSVSGSSLDVLRSLAQDLGLLAAAEKKVGSRDWSKRLYGARILAAFGAGSPLLSQLLSDKAPEVRAQAARWAGAVPSEGTTELVIALLDDPDGLCRFEAQNCLINIGLAAVPALVPALTSADDRIVERALQVAASIGDDRVADHVIGALTSDRASTRAAAAAALAGIGSSSSGPLLEELLTDESADVRRASAKALATLGHWPASPAIERLLDDDRWDVRREAAVALGHLGAPGQILLRVVARCHDRSADMAGQVLQLDSAQTGWELA